MYYAQGKGLPLQLLSMQCQGFCLLERRVKWSWLRIRLTVCSKLTILHPFATNVLKSGALRGHVNSGFNFIPVMFGQNDTLSDSITWQCLLIVERPESVKEHPLKSKDVKVRPTAKQICERNALTSIYNFHDVYSAWNNNNYCVGCWKTSVWNSKRTIVPVLNNSLVVPDHWTNC